MTSAHSPQLRDLLGDLADTHEIVLRRAEPGDPLLEAWRMAAQDAREAYAAWGSRPGPAARAAYLAAADQEDAAAVALRAACPDCPHAPRPLAA